MKLTKKAVKAWLKEHDVEAKDLFTGLEDNDGEFVELFQTMLIDTLLPDGTAEKAMEMLDELAGTED